MKTYDVVLPVNLSLLLAGIKASSEEEAIEVALQAACSPECELEIIDAAICKKLVEGNIIFRGVQNAAYAELVPEIK